MASNDGHSMRALFLIYSQNLCYKLGDSTLLGFDDNAISGSYSIPYQHTVRNTQSKKQLRREPYNLFLRFFATIYSPSNRSLRLWYPEIPKTMQFAIILKESDVRTSKRFEYYLKDIEAFETVFT